MMGKSSELTLSEMIKRARQGKGLSEKQIQGLLSQERQLH